MAVVSLLHTTDSQDWCTYLLGILKRSENLKVDTFNVHSRSPAEIQQAARESLVFILLTTDDFLCFLDSHAATMGETLALLREHCPVVLLELFPDRVRLEEILGEKYHGFQAWRRFAISPNPKKVTDVCAEIMTMVEESETASKQVDKAGEQGGKTAEQEGRGQEYGSRRIPSSKGRSRRKDHLPSHRQANVVDVIPRDIFTKEERIIILLKRPAKGSITYGFDGEDTRLVPTRLSDTAFQFKAPDMAPGRYKLCVYEDGVVLNKRNLTYAAPSMATLQHSPESLMACLGQDSVEDLDAHLASLYEQSLPEDEAADRLKALLDRSPSETRRSDSEWPTLLHWASGWGLSELVGVLLEAPGAAQAFHTENRRGLDPADLAETHGHQELADYIRDFMGTQMVVEAYADLYERMDNVGKAWQAGRDEEDTYTIASALPPTPPSRLAPPSPEAPRPSSAIRRRNTFPDRSPSRDKPPVPPRDAPPPLPARPPLLPSKPPPPRSNRSASESDNSPSDCAPPPPVTRGRSSHNLPRVAGLTPASGPPTPTSSPTLPSVRVMDAADFMGMRQTDPLPPEAQGSYGQKELLELLQSVKEGEFTQTEAQRLFRAWQQRYGSGKSKSFKDRRAQLEAMRKEYVKLLDTVDESVEQSKKRTSVLDRLFGRKKRQKQEHPTLEISGPLPQTSPRKGTVARPGQEERDSGRYSSASTSSSTSTCSSRDSTAVPGDSDAECHSVEEEDEEEESVWVVTRSVPRSPGQHRLSRKDYLLAQVAEEEVPQPPPRPPRTQLSRGKPVPAPR